MLDEHQKVVLFVLVFEKEDCQLMVIHNHIRE